MDESSANLTLSENRLHFGIGKSIRSAGGIHSVIKGISIEQEKIGMNVAWVDDIHFWRDKFECVSTNKLKWDSNNFQVNHYHFGWTYLQSSLFHPLKYRGDLDIMHFHGPWALESEIEAPNRKLTNLIKLKLERHIYSDFPIIVCDSEAFRRTLIEVYGVPAERTRYIALGVDVHKYRPADPKVQSFRPLADKSNKVIGTVRRLVPRMGIEFLIKAMLYLPDFRLKIVGKGESERIFRKLISDLGLEGRVELIGYLKDAELPEFYQSIDLLVIPSTSFEGFGLVSLEAFACGTPVIATAVDGLKESVGKMSQNLLFEPNDELKLAEKVQQILASPMFSPAEYRAYALENSWYRTTNNIENLISELKPNG